MSFVKLFESSQTGAPALSGSAGNLISLLDAVLVNGFNLKSVASITRSGSTATATVSAGHGFRENDVVLQAGAGQTEYNGEFRIFNVTSTTYQFTVTGSPATPATGTITAKIAPAGWTKSFSGTNKAAYKSADVTATGCLLRVDDSTAKYASVAGYESMTDIDTGSGAFADTISVINKSSTADAATRPWMLVCDGLAFYLLVAWRSGIPNYEAYFYGDVVSYKAGDAYNCVLIACTTTSSSDVGQGNYFFRFDATTSGKRIARAYSQLGGAVAVWQAAFGAGLSLPTYPSPVDNGANLTNIYVAEGSQLLLRGQYPGWYLPIHAQSALPAHGTVITDIPSAPGRRFMVAITVDVNANAQRSVFDLTGPWR